MLILPFQFYPLLALHTWLSLLLRTTLLRHCDLVLPLRTLGLLWCLLALRTLLLLSLLLCLLLSLLLRLLLRLVLSLLLRLLLSSCRRLLTLRMVLHR